MLKKRSLTIAGHRTSVSLEDVFWRHLKALARISRFFRDAEFRQKLIGASSLDDVFRTIEEEDAKF